jgi:hypothetical protein
LSSSARRFREGPLSGDGCIAVAMAGGSTRDGWFDMMGDLD